MIEYLGIISFVMSAILVVIKIREYLENLSKKGRIIIRSHLGGFNFVKKSKMELSKLTGGELYRGDDTIKIPEDIPEDILTFHILFYITNPGTEDVTIKEAYVRWIEPIFPGTKEDKIDPFDYNLPEKMENFMALLPMTFKVKGGDNSLIDLNLEVTPFLAYMLNKHQKDYITIYDDTDAPKVPPRIKLRIVLVDLNNKKYTEDMTFNQQILLKGINKIKQFLY